MEQPNTSSSSSFRVLIRPSPTSPAETSSFSSSSSSNPPNPPPPRYPPSLPFARHSQNPSSSPSASAPSSSSPDGVVVVGFLGNRSTTDVSYLINRILDSNVFGSGNLDKDFPTFRSSDIKGHEEEWFQHRRISYYYEAEKGLVFLYFSSSLSPLLLLSLSQSDESASIIEECEADDIRGMLFMFLVCHVIIFFQKGLRFDTQILKKFRMLQAAKHALAPFVRSQITPMLVSRSSSSVSQPAAAIASSLSPPSRGSGATNRHSSAISLMSSSGAHPSVLPGQCTPIILFVFDEDFSCGSPNSEDLADTSGAVGNQKPGLTLKGSGSVIMLTRPVSKTESSFKKKLHSSLEAQIRFLIKKCRILVGGEPSNPGSRGVGNVNSLPLFSLDASRVVALLERSTNQRGESLDFVAGLMEETFNSKEAADMFMFENHCQTLNNEDVQLIRDFIYRQSDTLRGRGGPPGNANSGSVAGVGMVAAAAAAAAASAAAGKPVSAPELPSLENWLSSSRIILNALTCIEHCFMDEFGNVKRLSSKGSTNPAENEQVPRLGSSAAEASVSYLESSKGLNMKFSTSWCLKALPAAKEVYLKDLPACYPTALHKTQLDKALHAFHSSVRGPAVPMFMKKLERECISIWESGRQLCDAISLTGKPCMHKRHNVKEFGLPLEAVAKHASGYVFLHACACGRSRNLRDDPFDFDSANITFNQFANCDDLLPSLILPKGINAGPLPLSSWSLLRLGGARYYRPSKGLLQIGFCASDKFLSKWRISLEKQKGPSVLPIAVKGECPKISSTPDTKAMHVVDEENKKSETARLSREVQPGGLENQRKLDVVSAGDTSISFGRGLPSFTMKKPFSEVVAGTVVMDSAFPVLQQNKQPKTTPGKGVRQMGAAEQTDDPLRVADDQGSRRAEHVTIQESSHTPGTNCHSDGDPILQIGSNIVLVNSCGGEKIKPSNSLEQVVVYIGFEHECSYGHRFLLSSEHLMELDSSYSLSENSHSSAEDSERKYVKSKSGLHEQVLPYSSRMTTTAISNMKGSNRTAETASNHQTDGFSVLSDSLEEHGGNCSHVRLDDGGSAFSLLNRNLPVYMKCPHCRNSRKQNDKNMKFASTISQLQRIFVVTPPFPTVLATCPVIQFEDSCLPPSIPNREQQSRFSIGCRVILPPESFLTLRLPFVYGFRMDDGSLQPVNHLEGQPELSAWLVKCTALEVVSMGHEFDEEVYMQ